jgi:hypothetical protein
VFVFTDYCGFLNQQHWQPCYIWNDVEVALDTNKTMKLFVAKCHNEMLIIVESVRLYRHYIKLYYINLFNLATFLYLTEAMIWISNAICTVVFFLYLVSHG